MKELPPAPALKSLAPGPPARSGYLLPAAPSPAIPAPAPKIGVLPEFLDILKRHKETLLLLSTFGLVAGLLVTLPQRPIYQAKASLEVQELNDPPGTPAAGSPAPATPASLPDIQTQVNILQSETLTDRVLEKLKVKRSADGPGQPRPWRKAFHTGIADDPSRREQEFRQAAKSLHARAAGQSRLIEIVADCTNPKLAAEFVNTLANEYIEQNMEARWKMTERTGLWLTRQLEEMRVKLERSEDELQAYGEEADGQATLESEPAPPQADRVSKPSALKIGNSGSADSLPAPFLEPAEDSVEYQALQREVENNRQLYEALEERTKQANVAWATRVSNIRIVDAAKTPQLPYKPDIPLHAGLGWLAGLLAGIAFLIVREHSHRTLKYPGDAARYLNIVELGVIPSASPDRSRLFSYRSRMALDDSPSDLLPHLRIETVTWQRKPSPLAESFRAVLTSILFSARKANRPQTIMIASAGPQEGKTTLTCNLGVALAEVKGRVLLIDGDMRRPRLHDVFEVPNDYGLSTLLREPDGGVDLLRHLVYETMVPGLFVLPSGPVTASAANLLHSDVMPELLRLLETEFDMILIDTPPSLPTADARVMGRLVDGVVMVVRSGQTNRDAAIAVRQKFADDQTEVIGVVLNDWNPKSSSYGFYGQYSKLRSQYSRDGSAVA